MYKQGSYVEVGTETHSDIGFQLAQFPGGKKVRERQGGESANL